MNLMREKAQKIAQLMAQMANEYRLLVLCALLEAPMTVGELAKQVPGISLPALSQHLHRLRDGGLIEARKQGQFVQYSLKDQHLRAVMKVLKAEYCDTDSKED